MKMVVFGATGSVGWLVVESLVRRRHAAVGVSRSQPRQRFEGQYECRIGDMTDPAFVASVVQDCDAVIFCIGQRRKSEKNLWSRRVSPPDIRTQVTKVILQVIGSDQSKRFVYLGAFGVGDDLKKHSLFFRIVLRTSSLGDSYADHDRAERLIRASTANWMIVRSPGLTYADKDLNLVDSQGKWSSFSSASRKSVARFLVETAESNTMARKTITVVEGRQGAP